MKKILLFTATITLAAGVLSACQKAETEAAQGTAPEAAAAPAQTPKRTAQADAQAPQSRPGRGCLTVTAEHPYNLKDMRFDEAAQALAHATGCFIRYDDQELSAQKIAPVEGRMSIRDAVQKSLEGSAYAILSATDAELVVGKRTQ